MNQADDDPLLPIGEMSALAGMWSLVVLVVLVTAACM